MVYRRKKVYRKKPYKKRMYKRKYTPKNKLSAKAGFPKFLNMRMKVTDNLAVSPGSTVKTMICKINNIKDFFLTAGANQPNGYDQINGVLYNSFYVGSGLTSIKFSNETANDAVMIAYYSADATEAGSYEAALERSKSQNRLVTSVTGSKATAAINMKYSTLSVAGINKFDQDYAGLAQAEPLSDLYLHIFIQSQKSTGAANLTGMIYITNWFNVKWFDRIDLAQSVG